MILRAFILVLTAILATTGLVLAVVGLLAAQWLLVAVVVLLVMGAVWAIVKGLALVSARCSGTNRKRAVETSKESS